MHTLMYKTVALSDADSESEYTDHPKSPILGGAQLPPKRRRAGRRRQRRNNKFQGAHLRRKHMCLGIAALVTLFLLVVLISINNNNNSTSNIATNTNEGGASSTPWKCRTSFAVLNWENDELPHLNSNNTVCPVVLVRNTTLLEDSRNYGAVVVNSTLENVLTGRDLVNVNPNASLIIFGTNKPLQSNNISLAEASLRIYDKIFSYSLQSDFIWQSYKIVRRNDSRVMAPTLQPQWDAQAKNFASNASRTFEYERVRESSPLAMAMLNRPCQVARKELIERIMQNMDVHTYGYCGQYSCGEHSCHLMPNGRGNRTYKFFLAFEEELCEDYVGESFYKALGARMLPVVFGGANYTRFAPPNSYINARDYASIRELTEYLLYLDQNPEEHIKYFTWRDWYKLQSNEFELQEICEYLESAARDKHTTHDSLKARNATIASWLRENMCGPYELPEAWTSGASE